MLTSCNNEKPQADLVILNAKVITMDESMPEAEAISVKGDTIQAVGTNDLIKTYIGESTKQIDAKGKLVIPGLIESHAHFMSLGNSNTILNLSKAMNWDEIIAMVVEEAQNKKPGEWILGRGWHQEKWDPPVEPNINGYPFHNMLSRAVPRNPVMLTHASGHAVFANKMAMDIAGIDTSTQAPEGGHIVKDTLGNPIGIFEEDAAELITNAYEQYLNKLSNERIEEIERNKFNLAAKECLRNGITTFHDAGESFEEIDRIKSFIDEGLISPRLYVMIYEDNPDTLAAKIADYKIIGYGDNRLTVRSIKRYIDGALGSRGALMLTPYSDLPDYAGIMTTPLKLLEKEMRIAFDNGFQVCTHAIGDRGNRLVLDLYEKILGKTASGNEYRWRIEHAQHLSTRDIPRFAELGVIAAMQGIHCTSDAPFVIERLGRERARRGAYVWRKLIDSGAIVCNGTDTPVESINPFDNFFASVTRKTKNGIEFFPEQKMTRIEALKSYTINGAYAAFEENIKGSITEGKLADIVILSKDILTIPDWDIPNTKVEYTILGGKIVYKAAE